MSHKIRALFACLLLAACNLPSSQTASQPQAWFDSPMPDTVIYPPNPCHIIAHGASPNGVSAFDVYVNGAFAFNQPANSEQTLATLEATCPLLNAGKNVIEARAQDSSGNWSDFAQTTVILAAERLPDDTPSPLPTETPASTLTAIPTLTATPIPTLTPLPTSTDTPQPIGSISLERISTNLVYLGGTNCGPTEVTFVARAVSSNITAVVLFYRFQTSNSSTEFQGIAMNPTGGDLYERTINPTSALGGAVPFDAATLQYQIVIQQTDGDTSIRTPVFSDITAQACGGGSTSSCSQYTDQRACISNSCNWVEIPGVVPIYECRDP